MPCRRPRPDHRLSHIGWLAGTLIAIAVSFGLTGWGQRSLVNLGGWPQFWQFLQASWQPELSPEFLHLIGQATLVTLAYAVCGTVLSLALGLVAGILASAVWWRTLWPQPQRFHPGQPIWLTIRAALAAPRAIHELIWGLFFLNLLGLDPLVAVLAIAIPFSAIVAKVFSEILDETPHEPLQALISAGVPPLSAFCYGLLPQALPNLLSYSFYRFECSLRSAAILGVIGAGGLGYQILLSLQSLRYQELWTSFYALILLNGAVDAWSGLLRRQLGFTSRLDLQTQPRQNVSSVKAPQLPSRQSSKSGSDLGLPGSASAANALMQTAEMIPLHPPQAKRKANRFALGALQFPGSHAVFVNLSLIAIALAIPLCFWRLSLDWHLLVSDRTGKLLQAILAEAQPRGLTFQQLYTLLDLAGQTVAMSVLAIALAGLGGLVFSFLAAQTIWLAGGVLQPIGQKANRNLAGWSILGLSRLTLLVARAIPTPIWALVLLYLFFPGILPGALALGLHNFGILGRLMAEVNENTDDRPARSLRTAGASALATILYGLLPENLPRFIAYTLYRWEVCLRETAVVGLVGAGGLGRLLTEQLSSFDYGGLVITLIAFVLLTFSVDLISAALRRAVR
ncbi:PhnE/PtxC family ABC transporter permease [Almyronema epifaneia]|uniref:PhnE/PtxC family ABC transporter permease n=1 Tax=Almyronema epifaneia S1 TaxID=2991925 RepID=A0ABW6IHG5_9CYAN